MEEKNIYEGKVWLFGDNVDTDNIFPTRFGADPTPQVMGTHVFIDFRPDFNKNAQEGDIVIAGYNFGYGSYRETAATGLRARGIRVIVARSFARAYYRNAVNLGMFPLTIGDMELDFAEGDMAAVNIDEGTLTNARTGSVYACTVPSGLEADIIRAGGATTYFRPMVVHRTEESQGGAAR
jgi:3-isopropylmalate dehydratase, small subunit